MDPSTDTPDDMTIVPPSYADDGLLQATTAVKNQRYDTDTIVYPTEIRIPASTHSATCLPECVLPCVFESEALTSARPAYVPQGWTPHINPEGAPYWVNTLPTICIVTDAPMHKRDVYEKVLASTEMIQDFAERLDFKWPKNSELYVRPQEGNDGCAYYIVDHDYQTELWLQDMDTQVLDIPDASSMDHLNHLTSESSHFPYNADMCEKFVKILDGKYDTDPYTTWIAGMCFAGVKWSCFTEPSPSAPLECNWFTQFHGEDHARLHRFQRRCEVPLVVNNAMMRLCSRLLFGMPTDIQESLGRLYIDRVTYDMHWRTFISAQICGWRESAYLRGISLHYKIRKCRISVHRIDLCGPRTGFLDCKYHPDAPVLQGGGVQRKHRRFWPVALAYSLPKALLYWSVASLAVHFLVAVT
ncbi:predicted protein [Postia placenta Mad-698-R]|nr:predicted protein [Postia placenta Mad-698-R]